MTKSGDDHVKSLVDGRDVFLDGTRIDDVSVHPAFRNVVASTGKLFDFAHDPTNAELMTYAVTGAEHRANRIWQLPKSYDELVTRRRALEAWSELHAGFMGRAPDHVASCISGIVMGLEQFTEYDRKRATALRDYYHLARDEDLYLTYVIINPQADRSKPAHQQADLELTTAVVDEDAAGITLQGAKMLATGGIMANEVFVTCIQPLQPGDEKFAISCVVPMNAKGLKILSRKSYEAHAVSLFDNPISARFDENDAVLFFDQVKVPWERVFVNQNIDMCQRQFHATPAHVYQNYQAQVRLMVKMRFLVGVARRTAEINGTLNFPQVREQLGQLAAEAASVDAMVHAMEVKGQHWGDYFVPDRHTLYAAAVLAQQLYPRVMTSLRDLAGGGMIMLPSSIADFAMPEQRRIIDKTQQSPVTDAEGRVAFFKLAWDAVGSEFASRHTQYEMFYSGAQFVTKAHSFRTFDWQHSQDLVEKMMQGVSLEDELAKITPENKT